MSDDGMDDGMPDDGMPDDGMDDGMPDDGMDDGMPDDGMSDDGMPDDGMSDDGMSDDDVGYQPANEEEQAVMDAWALIFDPTADFSDKAAHFQEASGLEEVNAAFGGLVQSNGASLNPTAVSVDGDTAMVTFDLLLGGQVMQADNAAPFDLVDGTWAMPRAAFCGFFMPFGISCEPMVDDAMSPSEEMVDDAMSPSEEMMDDAMDDAMSPSTTDSDS